VRLIVGGIVVAIVILGTVFAFTGTAALPSDLKAKTVKVRAEFKDAVVSKNADVTVAGVRVGKVEDIVPEGPGRSVVVMRLTRTDLDLKRDATAQIRSPSILGAKYVNLTLGSSPDALPDNFIPVDQTSVPFDIEEFFKVFSDFTTGPLKRSLTQQTEILHGVEGDFGEMITNLNGVLRNGTATFKGNEKALSDLIDGLNDTMAELRTRTQTLQSLLTQASNLFALLKTKQQQIHDLAVTQDRFFRAINARSADFTTLIDELTTNVDLLNRKRGQLIDLLDRGSAAFDALHQSAPGIRRLVDNLDYLTRSLDINRDQFVEQTRIVRTFRDTFGNAQAQGNFWTLNNRAPFGLSIGVLFETLKSLGISLPPELTDPISGGEGGGPGPGPGPGEPGNDTNPPPSSTTSTTAGRDASAAPPLVPTPSVGGLP
jgi:phospholipid/cholesterol/gamma-HCH transport system substrate-binding protein